LKTFTVNMIAFVVGLTLNTAALTQTVSDNNYLVAKQQIELDVRMAKSSCAAFSGNTRDICVAQAKGREMVAEAELDDSYKPTPTTHYLARAAKADADFAVANERCDDLSSKLRDVCRKTAKAAEISAKADAKAEMRSTEARDLATKKSAIAHSEAIIKSYEARIGAASEKLEAQYEVTKAKCGTYAGFSRENCLNHAKSIYGKT
jgi:pullulanase/glycogen debranching enzyme